MAKRPRTARRAKWLFTILAALLLGVEIASGWFSAAFPLTPHVNITVGHGLLLISDFESEEQSAAGWRFDSQNAPPGYGSVRNVMSTHSGHMATVFTVPLSARLSWWPRFFVRFTGIRVAIIPLWIPLVPVVLAAALLWRSDRRRRASGQCLSCGYDRVGLSPDALCPECGKECSGLPHS